MRHKTANVSTAYQGGCGVKAITVSPSPILALVRLACAATTGRHPVSETRVATAR
jgi:hypothetical protein